MVISVLEFDYHAEVLRDLLRIASNSNGTLQLRVFTNDFVWNRVQWQDANYTPEIYIANGSVPSFVTANKSLIEDADYIVLQTMDSHFKFWASITWAVPFYIRVHNSIAFFGKPSWKPILTPRMIWKDISHFLRKGLFHGEIGYRKRAVQKASGYLFPTTGTLKYAIEELNAPTDKCHAIPMGASIPLRLPKPNVTEGINIAIIGKIEPRNRDYETVLGALEILSKQSVNTHLTLAGRSDNSYAEKLVQHIEELPYITVNSFTGYVPQNQLEQVISNAKFLIAPVVQSVRFHLHNEYYGYTKVSGAELDLIKYQKHVLFPAYYPIPKGMEAVTGRYGNSKELATHITRWGNPNNLLDAKAFDSIPQVEFKRIVEQYSALPK